MESESLGVAIRQARQRAGLQAVALARAVGVSRATVHNWESGTTTPSEERLAQIAAALGTTSLALRYGETPRAAQEVRESPVSTQPATPRVAAGLPYQVRVWLQDFLLEITKGGATEEEVEEARTLLTSPEVFVYFSGGAPQEFDEGDVLDGMQALAEGIRRRLRKLGRKL